MRRLPAFSLALPIALLSIPACRKTAPPPPSAGAPAAPSPMEPLRGVLLERLDVPNYSYLRIRSGAQEVWAAVPTSTVEKGSEVAIQDPMPMKGFESKALGRTFDVVYFGTLAGSKPGSKPDAGAGAAPPMGMSGALMGHPAPMAPDEPGDAKVEKAKGAEARTVAELWAQKQGLKDKSVLIRGKVVRYNPGILGRNWVHLRDGSGSSGKGDHDITLTTTDTAAVGEIVTARGTVALDKDFGSGYTYKVLLENGQLVK